jgi:hypothetical protein
MSAIRETRQGDLGRIVILSAILFASGSLAAVRAHSQERGCTEVSLIASFSLTDANRITKEQFLRLIPGHQVIYIRPSDRHPIDMRYVRFFRADGSLSATCEYRQRRGDTSWYPCKQVGGNKGSRVIAVWRTADSQGVMCERAVQLRGDNESCYSFHKQESRVAVKHLSGPWICMAGDVEVR